MAHLEPVVDNVEHKQSRPDDGAMIRELLLKTKGMYGIQKCRNCKILLPLRFYVKSILVILKHLETVILTISAALNFEFLKIFDISSVKFPKLKILHCLS